MKFKRDVALIHALAPCECWHISPFIHLQCERGAAVRTSAGGLCFLFVRSCAHLDDMHRKKISHLRGRALAVSLFPSWELVRILMWSLLVHLTVLGVPECERCKTSVEN